MNKLYYTLIPNLIVPLAGLSTDIYVPSFPAMVTEFGVARADVQLTMTAYVLAMGLAQLLAGPISDALGRKKQIISAILLQLISMIAIVYARDIYEVMIARFFQGLGAAFMIVPARAILNDCFEGAELKKKFNYLTISFAIAPIVAPFIGGYCEYYFGWRISFYFVFAYALLLLILLSFSFNETLKEPKQFKIKDMWHNYAHILSNKTFVYSCMILCVLFGYSSLGSVLGPFIFQTQLGVSPVTYGYIALSLGFAWFLGNLTNRFIFNYSSRTKILFTLSCHTLLIVTFLLASMMGVYSIGLTVFCLFIMIFATGLIFPIFVSEALSLFPKLAASSNACLFALTWIAFAVYTMLATFIPVKTLVPISCAFLAINLVSYIVCTKIKPHLD